MKSTTLILPVLAAGLLPGRQRWKFAFLRHKYAISVFGIDENRLGPSPHFVIRKAFGQGFGQFFTGS